MSTQTTDPVEPLFTLAEAAEMLNLKLWLIRRAVKRGEIPTYSIGNTRKRVLLSEVVEVIRRSREGDDR